MLNTPSSLSGPFIEAYCDNWPEIDDTAYIASTAAIMGSVRIGADCSIWHNVTLRGDANYITIGKGSNIQDNSVVHIDSGTLPTIIGEYVTVGHGAIVHACTLQIIALLVWALLCWTGLSWKAVQWWQLVRLCHLVKLSPPASYGRVARQS